MHHAIRTLCLSLPLIAPLAAAELPLHDGHIHYSANAHGEVSPERALALLDAAGIARALVSSTPDDGTLTLHRLAPERIVPVLRPYRDRGDMGGWHRDPEVVEYVAARLATATAYRGLGEFHLEAADVASPQLARLIGLARDHGLFLHAHTDAAGIAALVAAAPGVRILWAHAGLGEPVTVVDAVLTHHPGLRADLSYRYDDILQGAAWPPPGAICCCATPTASCSAATPGRRRAGRNCRPSARRRGRSWPRCRRRSPPAWRTATSTPCWRAEVPAHSRERRQA